MNFLEEIQKYLPTYLTPESKDELLDGLRQFPDNINDKIFTSVLEKEEIIYQGDGFKDLLFTNLPAKEIAGGKGMVFSNTCDINPENKRAYTTNIIYAPIIDFKKFINSLEENNILDSEGLGSLVENIKKQRVTQLFYLPKYGRLSEEAIVFLDRINNCDVHYISKKDIPSLRLFSLSNYGLYIFLVKISMHLTRIQEKIDRSG